MDLQLPMQSVPITAKVVSSNLVYGEMYSVQHYVIKFVSDLRQVGGFLRVLLISFTKKTDHHEIAQILLKVALNTITHTLFLSDVCNFTSGVIVRFKCDRSWIRALV
jgi:hypothetical protein